MNRNELDAFVEHYSLSEAGVVKAFELTHAIPTRTETLLFLRRVIGLGAVLSLMAGMVFFIAANWDELGVVGHFALLQSLFVLTVGLALWRSPPHNLGRLSLLAAFIVAGGSLALFGQTYQTGANVYELFFMWALLGLPLVVAARWSVCWAAWLLVLNVALMLFCGFMPGLGLLGVAFGGLELSRAASLLIPVAVNLALWFVMELSASSYVRAVSPQWLRRIAVSFGVAYATWAGAYVIALERDRGALDFILGAILFVVLGAVALYALRKREDVLPLAAIVGCVIFLGLVFISEHYPSRQMTLFFVMALWLIGTSTLGGRLLMKLQRAWRIGGVR